MITAIAIVLIALVTIVLYPEECARVALAILPPLSRAKPYHFKFGVFAWNALTILGITLRTLGRLSNEPLHSQWKGGHLQLLHLGAVRNHS